MFFFEVTSVHTVKCKIRTMGISEDHIKFSCPLSILYSESALVSRCGSEPILKKSPPDVSDVMKNFAKLSTVSVCTYLARVVDSLIVTGHFFAFNNSAVGSS